jgi:putative acetyltransferase
VLLEGKLSNHLLIQDNNEDINGVHALHELAFGQPQETNTVDKLRNNCEGLLSFVAIEKDKIVGHVLFSPAEIEGQQGTLKGMGLAPMAVLPDLQRKGIGTRLINRGIEELRNLKCPFIIVLGHPEYYPRFGFENASTYGIKCRWEGVPADAFMIFWLDKSKAGQVSGLAKYREEFNEAV